MKLTDISTRRLAAADPDDVLAVIPMGSVEQHTGHLPVGTDMLIALSLAERVEARHPEEVLLTPPIWFGASGHHMAYAGTVTVPSDLLATVVVHLVESLHRSSRLTRFLLLNGHGGNEPAMRVALEHVRDQCPAVIAWGTGYWRPLFAHLEKNGEKLPAEGLGHAGGFETSLMLSLFPHLVDASAATADVNGVYLEPWLYDSRSFDRVTHHGGVGDPTWATEEYGDALAETAVEALSTLVVRLRDQAVE